MSVTIVRGIPGSGKSTWTTLTFGKLARAVWPHFTLAAPDHLAVGAVFSADDFFHDAENKYTFDVTKLGEAHTTCLKRYTEFLRVADPSLTVVVDNTATSVGEVAPYAALAGAYGHSLRIVTLVCDPHTAWQRNVHGVPFKTVFFLDQRLRTETVAFPPYWPHEILPAGHAKPIRATHSSEVPPC